MTRVGFIGLGSQGGPMARAIVESGFDTTLWARRPESLEPYRDTAATYADTPAQLAARSDVVCLCVVGDDDVRGLAYGDDGLWEGALYVFDKRMSVEFSDHAAVVGTCVACGESSRHMQNCADPACRVQLVVCETCAAASVIHCDDHAAQLHV